MTTDMPARPQILPLQSLANRIVRGLLATPLVSRGIGGRLLTLYVTGRKSGRQYTIPVAYTHDGKGLLVGTSFAWGRNLRTGEQIEVRFKGRRRRADVEVFTGEAEVTELYTVICRNNRQFAKFNKVKVDDAGNPNPDGLHSAWAAGARAFRLTPR